MSIQSEKESFIYLVEPADHSGNVHPRSKFASIIENPADLPPTRDKWPGHEWPKYLDKKYTGWSVRVMDANTGELISN